MEPINNCLVKIDVFCPESRVELIAKPITKNIEMVPLLKENSEPVKVDNLPSRLSVYQFVAPRIVFLKIISRTVFYRLRNMVKFRMSAD